IKRFIVAPKAALSTKVVITGNTNKIHILVDGLTTGAIKVDHLGVINSRGTVADELEVFFALKNMTGTNSGVNMRPMPLDVFTNYLNDALVYRNGKV
ncbi:MAG: hypothetical protein GY919_18125, partial [Photobacterium aquimaris]|nr:hypothetical protein [Photobacterium aquimaris]